MSIYLGLGANLGDRKQQLEQAIAALVAAGFRLQRVSPLVESPAMLPDHADPSWNRPYLNLAIGGDADWSPPQCLEIAKKIEVDLGREPGERWSPRPMDIDILWWRGERVELPDLTIPHPGAVQRDFVLTPLLHLAPGLPLGPNGETVFELSRNLRPIPLWMGIVNMTPDSFSDGDSWFDEGELDRYLGKMLEDNTQVIDIGAESTRPRGEVLPVEEEWRRLEPVLTRVRDLVSTSAVRPWISLDSRNPWVVEKALDYGIDVINDVTGLGDPAMMAVARDSGCQVVAMHSLSVPVDSSQLLPSGEDPVEQLLRWLHQRMETWQRAGLDLDCIIFDPGIGFGKTSIQAYELMSRCRELREPGLRLLVGHSRKSFMSGLTDRPAGQRDLETLGISMALCQQGVDIIRVHSPFIHARAYRAWSHVRRKTR